MRDIINEQWKKDLMASMEPRKSVVAKKKEIVVEGVESEIVRAGKSVRVAMFAFQESAKAFVDAVVENFSTSMRTAGSTRVESEGDYVGDAVYFISFVIKSRSGDFDITVFSNGNIRLFGVNNINKYIKLITPTVTEVCDKIDELNTEE